MKGGVKGTNITYPNKALRNSQAWGWHLGGLPLTNPLINTVFFRPKIQVMVIFLKDFPGG